MKPGRVYRPVVADSYHFEEEMDPRPDPQLSGKLGPDRSPHLSEKLDPDPH